MKTMNKIDNLKNQQNLLLGRLCSENRKDFLAYFLKYTKDMDKAEDMTQQLFLHLLLYKGPILPDTLKSFAFQAARRLIIDDARRVVCHRNRIDFYTTHFKNEIENVDAQQMMNCAQIKKIEKDAISTLGKKASLVYELSRFEGLSVDEIAAKTNTKRRTIESQLYFSRRYVRQVLSRVMVTVVFLFSLCSLVPAANDNGRYLFATKSRVDLAKSRITKEPVMANYWKSLEDKANKSLKNTDLRNVEYVSLAYRMTGKKEYAENLRKSLLQFEKTATWGSAEMLARKPQWTSDLGQAYKCYLAAVAYNAVRNYLSASDRKKIAKLLYRIGLKPAIGDWIDPTTRIHSLNSMGHNWWAACAGQGGMLALSLAEDLPEAKVAARQVLEAMPQWFAFEGDVLQNKPQSFDEAGGMYESVSYANYGIQEALLFLVAYKNMYPQAQLPKIPQLNKLADFYFNVCYPSSSILRCMNFGDGGSYVTGLGNMSLANYLGYPINNLGWYASMMQDGTNKEELYRNNPIGFLYTIYENDVRTPLLPTSHLWKTFGWATMRDSWQKDATMLAVKSGYTWNHTHADANSFILFHHGVDIIKDGGNCSYPLEQYRKYFFQSQAHNVVLFNGKGQSTEQQYHGALLQGKLQYMMDAGNMKYLLANGTGPMADKLIRNFRHFLWLDKVVLVIDDLESYEQGSYEWLWHTNGKTWNNNGRLSVENGNAAVDILPLYPALMVPSGFVHDYPTYLYIKEHQGPIDHHQDQTETYYGLNLPQPAKKVKGLTAIILKDNPKDKDLPVFAKRQGDDWIGVRMTQGDQVTDVYLNQLADGTLMHSNSWIQADGWTTDAYILAVTYNKKDGAEKAKRIFVGYGSSLRRQNEVWYSSLSKLYYMQTEQQGKAQFLIDGAAHYDAIFKPLKKTSQVLVNGKLTSVEKDKFGVRIQK